MSEQLDELIKSLEALAAQEQAEFARHPNASKSALRRHNGQLNRIRQRLDALQSLRTAAVHRDRSPPQPARRERTDPPA